MFDADREACASFSLRVSKGFRIVGNTRIEAIAEVFNLFNAKNPAAFTVRRFNGSVSNPVTNSAFMQPTEFAAYL